MGFLVGSRLAGEEEQDGAIEDASAVKGDAGSCRLLGAGRFFRLSTIGGGFEKLTITSICRNHSYTVY